VKSSRIQEATEAKRGHTERVVGWVARDEGRRPVRMFYIFKPGRRIVVLDGIVKKKDKIPANVLKRVRTYQREAESRLDR
jgi:hypothetical protein